MKKLPFQTNGLKALVFDLDGTLYQNDRMGNLVNLGACNYIALLRGVSVEQADSMLREARYSQVESGSTLSRAVISLGGNLKDLHERLSIDINPEGILSVDPRVPRLLKALATRFAVHIYTNNNRSLSARIMKEIGVSGLFGKVFTIEDYWRPKPDEGALLGILEAIGCKPEETLFVGDRFEVDLALPAGLGCRIYESCTTEQLLELSLLVERSAGPAPDGGEAEPEKEVQL